VQAEEIYTVAEKISVGSGDRTVEIDPREELMYVVTYNGLAFFRRLKDGTIVYRPITSAEEGLRRC